MTTPMTQPRIDELAEANKRAAHCPQTRDGEPEKSRRHCSLDKEADE